MTTMPQALELFGKLESIPPLSPPARRWLPPQPIRCNLKMLSLALVALSLPVEVEELGSCPHSGQGNLLLQKSNQTALRWLLEDLRLLGEAEQPRRSTNMSLVSPQLPAPLLLTN
jgi:hypothetical protein